MSSGRPVQTNETDQPYGNPPQSRPVLLPPFLSCRSIVVEEEERLTENPQRIGLTSAGYHNSAVEEQASLYPNQSSTVWQQTTHPDGVPQPHHYPYIPQGSSYGGGYNLTSQGGGWQDVVQPYTSGQYQAGPYAFPQGYIPISHERTSGSSAVNQRVEPDSPEPIARRRPTEFCDYSHPTPLSTAAPYPYQEEDTSRPVAGHDPAVSHTTRDNEVDAYRYHYNSRPNVSAAIHRRQVLDSSHQQPDPPPLLSNSLQHTPGLPQQEENQDIAPMPSTATADVGANRPATSESLSPSLKSLSPIWEFGPPHDTGQEDRRRRSNDDDDDDGEYVESPERRRTDEQGPWQEEKKKIVMACHFCRRRKLRCSGEQPCGHCAKRSMICEYDDTVKRRGKGKKTLRKASFRKNASVSSELPGTATDVGATDGRDRSIEPRQEVQAGGSARLDDTAG